MQQQLQKHVQQVIAKVDSLLPQYKVTQVLAMDTNKCAFKVTHIQANSDFCLKLFIISKNNNLVKILKIIKQLSGSPNLLQFYEVIYDNQMTYLAIIMDSSKMSLRQIVKREEIPEQVIWKVISDMCVALNQWHKKGLVHNRVKPSAIYNDQQGNFLLGEPDIHQMLGKNLTYSNMVYQSLEVLSKEPYNYKADVWSLGVVIYEMLNQTTPFKAKDLVSMKRAIVQESYSMDLFKFNKLYSRNLNNLTLSMLCINEKARPNLGKKLFKQKDQVAQFVIKASQTSSVIDIQTLINFELQNHVYVQQLISFMQTRQEDIIPLMTDQLILKPYSCMSTSFFRPGMVKSKVRGIEKTRPTIQLHVFDPVHQDEYQVNPFLNRMPEFTTKQEAHTSYAKYFKRPTLTLKTLFVKTENLTQENLPNLKSTFLNEFHTQKSLRLGFPKIIKRQDRSSLIRKEMFLHEIVKKYQDRQIQ